MTDSGDEVKAKPDKPGVANLLAIHSAITGEKIPDLEEKYSSTGYGEFKQAVAEIVVETLRPVREKYARLVDDKTYLDSIIKEGDIAAQKRAYRILSKVYRKVGFIQPAR